MVAINWNPSARELRQFAVVWAVFFAIVGALVLRRTGSWEWAALVWAAAGLVPVAGLAAPARIKPVFLGMSLAAYPIGWVVSHVLMIAVWMLVVTPTGLVMRALGHDPLQRRPDRRASTYWVRRHEVPPERYLRQY
jgi:hypothetical protein